MLNDFLKKLFGSKKNKTLSGKSPVERSKYMPEISIPVDEKFTINFRKNGGKFIYCDSQSELSESFQNILLENSWEQSDVFCNNPELRKKFKRFELSYAKSPYKATFFLTGCENLVADIGGILISSNQIGELKLPDFPDNFVVLATTSQIIESIGEGLQRIKNESGSKIPTNITTIKHFDISDEKDFMSYGSSAKNLYLLLLEDL